MSSTSPRTVPIANGCILGAGSLVLVAGPCVVEDEASLLRVARRIREIATEAGIAVVFKASYDKANRTSHTSFRGVGLVRGLAALAAVKEETGLPILVDVHAVPEVGPAAATADVLQIPAFLCRQTDLVLEVARSGRAVNIKKGQFIAPWDVGPIVEKVRSTGNERVFVTERGTSFGYNNLVSDLRAIPIIRGLGVPVVFDATHSLQLPGGRGQESGGLREHIPPLARAAVAAGADGVFAEVHECPARARSDRETQLAPEELAALVRELVRIHGALHAEPLVRLPPAPPGG